MKIAGINSSTTFKNAGLAARATTTAAKAIQESASSGSLNKFLLNASKWGDKEAILINGLGKALIAPLIILFNPFIGNVPSYKKENKAYMAIKQPVSAGVNLATQMSIFLGAERGFNWLLKKGTLAANYADPKQLSVLKSRGSLILALATMPVACAAANKLYAKVTNKVLRDKDKKYA